MPSPIFFNESVVEKVRTVQSQRYEELQSQWSVANAELARASNELLTERRGNEFVAAATSSTDTFLKARNELRTLRAEFKDLVKQQDR